ncbi:MAG: hypothetical protein HQQ73_00940 [Desulfobulbaceae bacterium]|nr:hypothetical protein [Desulfobulbaceae bacterium]
MPGRPHVFILLVWLPLLVLSACATVPPNLFVVSDTQLERRLIETRRYGGINETDLLAASANVLQDLGFSLENSETKLGVITANKQRSARNSGEIAVSLLFGTFGGVHMPVSEEQNIRVALVVRPVLDSKGMAMEKDHYVRVSFQRVVRRSDNSTTAQTLTDPALYQDFHDRLSKSVFIEAQKI